MKIHHYSSFQAIYAGIPDLSDILSTTPLPRNSPDKNRRSVSKLSSRESFKSISPRSRLTEIEENHNLPSTRFSRRKSFDSPRYQELQGHNTKRTYKRKQSAKETEHINKSPKSHFHRTTTAVSSLYQSTEHEPNSHRRIPSDDLRSLLQATGEEDNNLLNSPEALNNEENDKRRSRKKKTNFRKNSTKKHGLLEKKISTYNTERPSQPASPIKGGGSDSPPQKLCSTDKIETDDLNLFLTKSKKRSSRKPRTNLNLLSPDSKEKKQSNSNT